MQLISVEKKEKTKIIIFNHLSIRARETENDTKRYAQLSAKWPDKTDETVTQSFQTASSF